MANTYIVVIEFAVGGSRSIGPFDSLQKAEKRALEYIGADAAGVWIRHEGEFGKRDVRIDRDYVWSI
jgi:hypothetical protein